MKKAQDNFKKLFGEQALESQSAYLDRAQDIQGVNRVFRRMATTKDKEQLVDYLAEIKFALIFTGLGFVVIFEPFGRKGPDLGIERDNEKAVVEVKRFRKIYPGPPIWDLSDEDHLLSEYGNPTRDTRKAFENILKKFPQVENHRGIIAIWNDDEELEELETQLAVNQIRGEADKGLLTLPTGLLFVLYGSKLIGNKQLYCFPFCHLDQPFQEWQKDIEKDSVSDHIRRALVSR